ncbi:hypothetical protein B0H14DRAFT_2597308 [Mycena olivaceomarginata]|nr:hypothetical protein B0H14DRAFT_2597308 [Mycena olivaceomarginata]
MYFSGFSAFWATVLAARTKTLLKGQIPQELHPGMIKNRRRRELVQSVRRTKFPEGTGMKGVLCEFEKDKSRDIEDCYIHAVTLQSDVDIIITVNPDLAEQLNGLDKTFLIVWNGIFEAIKLITGKSLNFKVFSKTSSLLGAIGDSKERRHKASVMSLFCVR